MHFEIQTFVLGLVQGLCEFLPVSSSGHLALLQSFFGFSDSGNLIAFDLLLHCATVLAILIYFRNAIIRIIHEWCMGWLSEENRHRRGWSYGWEIIIASFITALIGLPLRKIVDAMSGSPRAVGCGLIFTAIVLAFAPLFSSYSAEETGTGSRQKKFSPLIVALAVGAAQGIAVLPGVSRSGMTIAAGLLMGLGVNEAFKFSFLISVPAVLGASMLELMKVLKSNEAVFLPEGHVWAVIAAFISGLIALGMMRRLVISGRWAYFTVYCLLIGSAAILLSLDIF